MKKTCTYEAFGSLKCIMDSKHRIEKFNEDPDNKPIYKFWWFYLLLLLCIVGFLTLVFAAFFDNLTK